MNCNDCNGAGTYEPLVGPLETCTRCGGSGQEPISTDLSPRPIEPDDFKLHAWDKAIAIPIADFKDLTKAVNGLKPPLVPASTKVIAQPPVPDYFDDTVSPPPQATFVNPNPVIKLVNKLGEGELCIFTMSGEPSIVGRVAHIKLEDVDQIDELSIDIGTSPNIRLLFSNILRIRRINGETLYVRDTTAALRAFFPRPELPDPVNVDEIDEARRILKAVTHEVVGQLVVNAIKILLADYDVDPL